MSAQVSHPESGTPRSLSAPVGASPTPAPRGPGKQAALPCCRRLTAGRSHRAPRSSEAANERARSAGVAGPPGRRELAPPLEGLGPAPGNRPRPAGRVRLRRGRRGGVGPVVLRLRAACSPGPAPRAARPPAAMEPGLDGPAASGPAAIREGWFRETCSLWPGQALSLQVEQLLHHRRSQYQDILVFRRYPRPPGPAPRSPGDGSQPRPPAASCPTPRSPPGLLPRSRPSPPLFLPDPYLAPFTSGCPRPSLPAPVPAELSEVLVTRPVSSLSPLPTLHPVSLGWGAGVAGGPLRRGGSRSLRRPDAPSSTCQSRTRQSRDPESSLHLAGLPADPRHVSPLRTHPWSPSAGWGRFFSPWASRGTLPLSRGTQIPDCHSHPQ